jgi:hypothetical protein
MRSIHWCRISDSLRELCRLDASVPTVNRDDKQPLGAVNPLAGTGSPAPALVRRGRRDAGGQHPRRMQCLTPRTIADLMPA